MTIFESLQTEHEELIAQETEGDLQVDIAQSYIEKVRGKSNQITNTFERDQLRAYLRYWSSFVYERTGQFPKTELKPANIPPEPMPQPAANVLLSRWAIIVGSIILIALCGFILFNIWGQQTPEVIVTPIVSTQPSPTDTRQPVSTPTPTDTPTPSPIPIIPPTPSPTMTSTRDVSGISVNLVDPEEGQEVAPRETLFGTYRNLRAGWTIHALVEPFSNSGIWVASNEYYEVPSGLPSGEWEIPDVAFGQEDRLSNPEQYRILMLVANSDGGREFLASNKEEGFSLDELPSELIPFPPAVTVFRRAYTYINEIRLIFSGISQVTGAFEIISTRPDGSDPLELTQNLVVVEAYPSLSPDGKKLIFVHLEPNQDDPDRALQSLWIMDSNGQNATKLTDTEEGYERPLWSPNGRYIAFSAFDGENRQVYVYDTKTDEKTQLTNDNFDNRFPSWLPSGDALIYNKANTNLFKLSFSVDANEDLKFDDTTDTLIQYSEDANDTHGVVNPIDSNQIAFTSVSAADYVSRIHILDEQGERLLMNNLDVRFPVWHPNGQTIYFESQSFGVSIWAVDVDGTNLRRITSEELRETRWPYIGYLEAYIPSD